MARKIDFSKMESLFKSNEEFSITESQYKELTGYDMPKTYDYLKNKSPFSKVAKQYGYYIETGERTVILRRVG